jgi:glycolate oxidase FAD binding subunit
LNFAVDSASLSIDDVGPFPVHRPESVADLCSLVKTAAAAGHGLYLVGGGTHLDLGLPPLKPGLAIDTTALNHVIDYPARDMTITVQAGITMAMLQATLAAEGQWLPIDVPQPERATLGGSVAANVSGPHRLGYGTLRDYVIGISFVTDEGQEVKAGGRVVKNVAGYDLMKLQVGALGTLGIVTQLTLKVKPKPEATALVRAECSTVELAGLLDALHASRSRPCVVEALSTGSGNWNIVAAFEEKAVTVEWQVGTVLKEINRFSVVPQLDAAGVWSSLTEPFAAGFAIKANVLPSRTAAFLEAVAKADPATQVRSEALSGIVHAAFPSAGTIDQARAIVEPLLNLACEAKGNLTICRCPAAWKPGLAIWGRPGSDRELMRTVKRSLDPTNLFNPGRLFGDL